jgi:hypothetical protein
LEGLRLENVDIFMQMGIFDGLFGSFMTICLVHFEIMYQEKSGNPGNMASVRSSTTSRFSVSFIEKRSVGFSTAYPGMKLGPTPIGLGALSHMTNTGAQTGLHFGLSPRA